MADATVEVGVATDLSKSCENAKDSRPLGTRIADMCKCCSPETMVDLCDADSVAQEMLKNYKEHQNIILAAENKELLELLYMITEAQNADGREPEVRRTETWRTTSLRLVTTGEKQEKREAAEDLPNSEMEERVYNSPVLLRDSVAKRLGGQGSEHIPEERTSEMLLSSLCDLYPGCSMLSETGPKQGPNCKYSLSTRKITARAGGTIRTSTVRSKDANAVARSDLMALLTLRMLFLVREGWHGNKAVNQFFVELKYIDGSQNDHETRIDLCQPMKLIQLGDFEKQTILLTVVLLNGH